MRAEIAIAVYGDKGTLIAVVDGKHHSIRLGIPAAGDAYGEELDARCVALNARFPDAVACALADMAILAEEIMRPASPAGFAVASPDPANERVALTPAGEAAVKGYESVIGKPAGPGRELADLDAYGQSRDGPDPFEG